MTQTVRLIRSKAVGVFFVTQNPTDVPSSILGQLGNRQHALRTFTPEHAIALRKTVSTFPKSADYDIAEMLTSLGIGEAAVKVLSDRGVPTPVAWTTLRSLRSLMGALDSSALQQAVAGSPLTAEYEQGVDRESAYERLSARLAPPPAPAPAPEAPAEAKPAPRRREREAEAGAGGMVAPRCSARPRSSRSRGRRHRRWAGRSRGAYSAPASAAGSSRVDCSRRPGAERPTPGHRRCASKSVRALRNCQELKSAKT